MGAYTLRTLNAAQPLGVRTDADGQPRAVRRPGGQPRAVEEVLDRWRIDDEWWRERPISREYWVLLLDNGGRLTAYHDLLAGSWHEQAGSGAGPAAVSSRHGSGAP